MTNAKINATALKNSHLLASESVISLRSHSQSWSRLGSLTWAEFSPGGLNQDVSETACKHLGSQELRYKSGPELRTPSTRLKLRPSKEESRDRTRKGSSLSAQGMLIS